MYKTSYQDCKYHIYNYIYAMLSVHIENSGLYNEKIAL
jgi:hypothetical protein